jgi:ubiquinone/menaquinone biosynthesis C-methylase UbiE
MQDPVVKNNTIYNKSSKAYPNDYRGVKWESAESQILRFKILCEISPEINTSSLLDIGCGLGHLAEYLYAHNFKGQYKGIDICNQMIELAKKKHPDLDFENNDIDSVDDNSVDYVLASGIFAFVDYMQLQLLIQSLFSKAKKGVAFNCLSIYAPEEKKESALFYPNPSEIFDLCERLTPCVTLRHDYLENDFTVYLYKNIK